jgi:hypothetical protein
MPDRIYYSSEAEAYAQRQQVLVATVAFILGISVSAVLSLLFAPQSGASTRRDVTDALEEGFRRGKKATQDAVSQLESEYPNLRERMNGMLDNVRA